MNKTTKRKLARLNAEESQTYSNAFEYYMNNVRQDTKRADRYAWKQTKGFSPRLDAYQGALP